MTVDRLDRHARFIDDITCGRLTRRDVIKRGAALGLSGSAIASLLTAMSGIEPAAAAQVAATPAAGTAKKGGELRVGLTVDIATLDPHFSGSKIDRQVFFNIYNALVTLDTNLTIKPGLAESWEAPDSKSYVFHLRQGVKFHDGSDFNAAAVKANFDRMMDPNEQSLRRGEIASIASVDVVDDATVKLNLKQPDSALLATLTDRAGMIISPTAIQKYGKDLARNPVGSGPFQFVEWQKGDHIQIKRFDGYWNEGLPYLDSVRYRVILDDSVRLAALKNGELDIVDTVPPPFVADTKKAENLQTIDVPSLAVWWFWLNTTKPPFDNKSLRQAFADAVDIETIVKSIYLGIGVPANGPISPASWAYDKSIPPRKQDLDKAKSELSAGGKADGFSFTFEGSNNAIDLQVLQLVQAQIQQVGLKMDITQVDTAKQIADTVAHNFQATWAQWSGRPDPDGNTYNHFHTDGGMNYGAYSNPEVDKLLEQARAVSDHEQRKQIYSQVTKLLQEDVPAIFIWHPDEPKAMTKKLHDYPPIPDGMMRFAAVWLD
jgi:peptide/nickel transport system substrate-binding protein